MTKNVQELSFRIDQEDKPIIYIKSNHMVTSCLIDTGANTPVWFVGEEYLLHRYPLAVKTDKKSILNGLGDKPIEDVSVWKIPEFMLTDDNDKHIIFHDLFISVLDTKKFSFDMIIPLTMLNRMSFMFDYIDSAVSATFKIYAPKDKYFVRPIYAKSNDDYLNKIQVFTQEE